MAATPFTDTSLVRGPLYASADRLAQRTGALHQAKIRGADAADTIAALTVIAIPAPAGRVADIGCGRGTTTVRLAEQWPAARLVAVDQSSALLAVAGGRLRQHGHWALLACADFHHLPLAGASVDLAVAAFCLYHSAHPERAVAEIGRCLAPGGRAILVTKSADSYHHIDDLLGRTGLDPHASSRPSLYRTFHSGNAEGVVAAGGLTRRTRVDQRHVFRFADFAHLAAYAVTSPKYQLPPALAADPPQLADALRSHLPDQPVTTTSIVTYLVVARS